MVSVGFQKHIRKVGLHSLILRRQILNQKFVSLVNASDELSFVTKPSLVLMICRVVPNPQEENQAGFSTEPLNNLNRDFFGHLSARRDIMRTQTSLNRVFCIPVRFAVGATRTNEGISRTLTRSSSRKPNLRLRLGIKPNGMVSVWRPRPTKRTL
jgi:aromatic-L-amino-acid decarboxylase